MLEMIGGEREMGSRKAMEEWKSTASVDLYRPPTLQPGLGDPRCPRCAASLTNTVERGGWTIAPILRDSISMAGMAVGGSTSAIYSFNRVMPFVRQRINKPMLQLLVGVPPVALFSVICAGLVGMGLPAYAQLAVTSYHGASAISHSTVSQLTMLVEGLSDTNKSIPTFRQLDPSSEEKG